MRKKKEMKFESDLQGFKHKTKIRFFRELAILVIVIMILAAKYTDHVPNSLKIVIVSLFFLYIVGGLVLYPKARKAAESVLVKLTDDGVEYSAFGLTEKIQYGNIYSVNAKKVGNKIFKVQLVLNSGKKMSLCNLQEMEVLYDQIQKRTQV